MAVVIDLVGELGHVGGNLGLQRGGQHLPSTIANNLIQQRSSGNVVVRLCDVVNYGEQGRTFPNPAR